MSKYDALWEYVRRSAGRTLELTFEEIRSIAGLPIDHSFLKYKRELEGYGCRVEKVSLKEQKVAFTRLE
ncbi:MAG: hypothetical protein ACI4L8_06830 [Candidatus Fimadaptatus sp.]